jgi:hypothetical protein
MANANWSNPTLTSTYTNFVTEVKNRDEDLALQFDGTTSTNIPTGTIRWDSSANRWKKWSGSTWGELATTYALTGLSTTGAASIGTTLTVTSTTALTGGGTSTTPATDNNSTNIATTAFVVGQAAATAPVMDGTATVGTSLRYARQDHVHPTDTSRAPLASPTFTGTVTIPAGASISGYLTTSSASSTYAPLASPALTGTPTAPTATLGTNTTQIATTAFVIANSSSFPSGTAMVFAQTTAPTGWTKVTTYNDAALRVVSGTASSGGTTAFSSVFTSRTPAGTVGATTLTTAQLASHPHSIGISTQALSNPGYGTEVNFMVSGGAIDSANTGGNNSHTHSFTGSAMDFAVKYVDTIIATKN